MTHNVVDVRKSEFQHFFLLFMKASDKILSPVFENKIAFQQRQLLTQNVERSNI